MPADPLDPPVLPPLPEDEHPTVEAGPASARRPSPPPADLPETPPRDLSRDGRRTPDGRRYASAGSGLVVLALGLAIAMLLSAPGIHKSAYNQPDGWKRDVSTALTAPLADISHALLLDRPRAAVKAAIGRSDDDDIDVAIEVPVLEPAPRPRTPTPKPTPTEPDPSTPSKPTKLAFTPKKQLRLWIAGDSLVITPGYAILRAAGASPVITGVGGVEGRVATGLGRPDVFNWFEEIREKVKELRPHAVVLGFGGNDDKAYMTGVPEGTSIGEFGGAAWKKEYRRRLAILFGTISKAGAHVIWIGLPITRSPEQTQRFDVVNAAVVAEARRWPGRVTYIDTYTLFAGPGGTFAEYLPNAKGSLDKVRAGDGVHFDTAGGTIIAREVLKALNRAYDLTSWRSKPSA